MQILVFYLHILFMSIFAKELILTRFKRKINKLIWFFQVFIFGLNAYIIYTIYRRRLVVKRMFNPNFSKCAYRSKLYYPSKFVSLNTVNPNNSKT